jgi:hypothetical protein
VGELGDDAIVWEEFKWNNYRTAFLGGRKSEVAIMALGLLKSESRPARGMMHTRLATLSQQN